jgi:hypothetical protein
VELWKKSQRQFDVVQKKATSQGNGLGSVHRNTGSVEMLSRIQKLYNTRGLFGTCFRFYFHFLAFFNFSN